MTVAEETIEEATVTTIPIDMVRTDSGTQPRASLDDETLEEYVGLVKKKYKNFPPIEVVYDGSVYHVYDGFHRLEAHRTAKKKEIKASVRQGTLADAQWLSYAANRTNGLRRSNEDKQRAVQAALRHSPERSDQAIADHVGVDRKTIAGHRKKLEEAGEIPVTTERIGADERVYEVPKSEEPEEVSEEAAAAEDQPQPEEEQPPEGDLSFIDQPPGEPPEGTASFLDQPPSEEAAEAPADAPPTEETDEADTIGGPAIDPSIEAEELPLEAAPDSAPEGEELPIDPSIEAEELPLEAAPDSAPEGEELPLEAAPDSAPEGEELPLEAAPVISPRTSAAVTAQVATMMYHQAMQQWQTVAPDGDDIWQSVVLDRDLLNEIAAQALASSCLQTAITTLAHTVMTMED